MLTTHDYMKIAAEAFAEADRKATEYAGWAIRGARDGESMRRMAELLFARSQAAATMALAVRQESGKRPVGMQES